MKKVIALLLAVLMIASLCACGNNAGTDKPADQGAQNPAPTKEVTDISENAVIDKVEVTEENKDDYIGKTLVVALESEPQNLYGPISTASFAAGNIIRSLGNTLFETNEDGEYVPCVAESYEWVDDLHLRIKLRQGVMAADGTEMTAEDVIYTWQVGLEGTAVNTYDSPFLPDQFVAEDDYTVVMVLDAPWPYLSDNLDELAYVLVSKSATEAAGGVQEAGLNPKVYCGRYNFVEWLPGQHVLLEYNENYWDKDYIPSYQYIKFTFIPDAAARCLAVKSGTADVATGVGLSDTLAYNNDPDVVVDAFTSKSCGGVALFYRCDEGHFADENVRAAFEYLIDWKACAKVFTGDESTVIQGWFNQGSPYYGGPDTREFNFEKGMEYLKKSAYPDGFEFDLKLDPTVDPTSGELIQSYLEPAGIKANIIKGDFATWFGVFATLDYECYIGGAASSPLNYSLGYVDARNGKSTGGPQVVTPELTEYLNVATSTFDEAERAEAIANVQRYCVEQRFIEGITGLNHYLVHKPGIGNIVPDTTGYTMVYFLRPTAE